MKTKLHAFLLIVACTGSLSVSRANNIRSTYVGPTEGNWGDLANWSPAVVPNNEGGNRFAVSISKALIDLDLDVSIKRLVFKRGEPFVLGGDSAYLNSVDHNFSSKATSVGAGGEVVADAETTDVLVDLGNLADFSGNNLRTGYDYALFANTGRTTTLQFVGARIENSNAGIDFAGPGTTRIVDQNGEDALAVFSHIGLLGFLDVGLGKSLTI